MARKMNVVLFSSGVSEKSGLVQQISDGLETRGLSCFCWRDLFSSARDTDHIALLPMLVKKIPTFDFAVIVCEGHDKTIVTRNGQNQEFYTMRDNVLFEIGMCTMALGLSKVILMTDDIVRLPDDLTGVGGDIGLMHLVFDQNVDTILDQAAAYIQTHRAVVTPVVIGAAASTASGYATNFIFRLLEKIGEGFIDKATGQEIIPAWERLRMEISIPYCYDITTPVKAKARRGRLRTGVIPGARQRAVEFTYTIDQDSIVIMDYPTTLITSYNTAKIILGLDADDTADTRAENRFNEKELDLFEATLRALLSRTYITGHVEHYYPHLSPAEQENMIRCLSDFVEGKLQIIRQDY